MEEAPVSPQVAGTPAIIDPVQVLAAVPLPALAPFGNGGRSASENAGSSSSGAAPFQHLGNSFANLAGAAVRAVQNSPGESRRL